MRISVKGRQAELLQLATAYHSKKSELVVIYGRRRVGKSSLIQYFIEQENLATGQKPLRLSFEGLENQKTPTQIKHFSQTLKMQIKDPLLQKAEFTSWPEIFDFLTAYVTRQKKKKILFAFDEFQWLAANQSKLVALIKYYWDNHWKNKNVMLILCGSIASFMVRKVLRSKALYGRFTVHIHLKKLSAAEVSQFFPKTKSHDEILRYLLVFGGVPKYLELIDQRLSFEQNIEQLFFQENSILTEEFDKIFNVHFKEPGNYLAIISALKDRKLNLKEIAQVLKMKSSGGVKVYLENLILAEFIRPVYSWRSEKKQPEKYQLADEFLAFYTAFILKNKRIITAGGGRELFRNTISRQLIPWFGLALENYVMNNAIYFASKMGFTDYLESFGAYSNKQESLQIDLLYQRADKTISICEIKFRNQQVSTDIIPEFEAKIKKLKMATRFSIHKVLIAPNGISKPLLQSEYFDHILTNKEIFS